MLGILLSGVGTDTILLWCKLQATMPTPWPKLSKLALMNLYFVLSTTFLKAIHPGGLFWVSPVQMDLSQLHGGLQHSVYQRLFVLEVIICLNSS